MYQILSEDLLISFLYTLVYPYQIKQSVSTDPEKCLLNVLFRNWTDKFRLAFSYRDSIQWESVLILHLFIILVAKVK